MAALKRAKAFDLKRLVTEHPDTNTPSTTKNTNVQESHAEEIETVYVLNETRSGVKYSMQNPRQQPDACICHTATQGSTCHHQIAWLLTEYPYGMQTEKLISVMLGQKLGYGGGCSLDDISPLTDALNLLELHSEGASSAPPSNIAAPPEHLDSDAKPDDVPVQRQIKQGRHKEWVMQVATRLCAVVDAVDSRMQDSVMQFQHAELDAVVKACESMVGSDTAVAGSNFCKVGDCNNARKKSFLEGKRVKKATACLDASAKQPSNFQVIAKPKAQTLKDATKKNMSAGAQMLQEQ
jgi:hypothetical protein